MASSAHISRSDENTLEARVNNFRSAYTAYKDVQMSQSLYQKRQMQDTLGTKEELEEANVIIKNSLDMSVKNFSKNDLKKAQQQGLISDFEAKNIGAIAMGKDLISSNEKDIQENKDLIAQSRTEMSDKNKEKRKDESRDI